MAEIAELGFKVDSKELKEANKELEKTPVAAAKAEAATNKLAGAYNSLSKSVGSGGGGVADAVAQTARNLGQYNDAATSTYRASVNLSSGLKGNTDAARAAAQAAAELAAIQKKQAAEAAASAAAIKSWGVTAGVSLTSNFNKSTQAVADNAAAIKAWASAAGTTLTAGFNSATQATLMSSVAIGQWANASGNAMVAMHKKAEALKTSTSLWGKFKDATTEAANSSRIVAFALAALATPAGMVAVGIGAAIIGFKLLEAAARPFIEAAIEAEQANSRLNNTLKATQGVSGQTADSLDEHATALMGLTVYSDDAVKGAQAVLLRFDLIREKFPQATEATIDLAASLGVDLESAARMVGKALQDPVEGMTALGRAGVKLNDEQQKTLKHLVETNQVAKAQAMVLAEVEKATKGAAAAQRDTLGGAMKALGVAWGEAFELSREQTGWLRGALEDLITAVNNPTFQNFVKWIGTLLVDALAIAVKGVALLVNGISLLIDAFVWLWEKGVVNQIKFFNAILKTWGIDIPKIFVDTMNWIIRAVVGGFINIETILNNFPVFMAMVGTMAANAFIGAIEGMINYVLPILYKFIANISGKVAEWTRDVPGLSQLNSRMEALSLNMDIASQAAASQSGKIKINRVEVSQATKDAAAFAQKQNELAHAMNNSRDYMGELGYSIGELTAKTEKQTAANNAGAGSFGKISKEAGAAAEAYKKMKDEVEKYIKAKEAETKGVGESEFEKNRLKHLADLIAKAIEAKIPLEQVGAQIKQWAIDMANADAAFAKATFMKSANDEAAKYIENQKITQATLGMTTAAAEAYRFVQEKINEAIRAGNPLTADEIALLKQKASAMEEVGNKTNQMKETFEFAKSTTKEFIKSLVGGLREGKDMMQVLGDAAMNVLNKIADKMIDMAVDELFADIFKGGPSGTGGSAQKGISSGLTGGGGGGGIGGMFDKLGDKLSGAWDKTTTWFDNIFGSASGGFPAGVGDLPAGVAGPAPNTAVGGMAGTGGMGGIGGSGISAMGAAGAGLGLITGGMQLANSKGTGDTIKGIGTMVGAVVSLIPGIGQIAGPIIMIASQLLGGLIGNKKDPITNQAFGGLNYGPGGYTTQGGAWGPDAKAEALTGPLAGVGKNVQTVFDLLGGVKDPSKVWGMALESISKTGEGWDFKSSSSFLTGPGGQKELWRMNEDDMLGTGGAQIAMRSVLGGAVGELTDNMRRGLESIQHDTELTFEKIGTAIGELLSYEIAIAQFGRTVTAAETAMVEVNASMKEYYDMAAKYNLDTAVLDAEKNRLRLERATTDFAQPIIDELLSIRDPQAGELAALDKWRKEAVDNNAYLVATVIGYQDNIANIEALYGEKRTDIVEKYAKEAAAALEEAMDWAQSIQDELLGLKDPQALELLQLDRWLEESKAKNAEYLATVTGFQDQLLAIEEIYGIKRQAILEKYLKPLDDLLKRLTPGGDLANVDQTATLAGLQATYSGALARSMASPNDQAKLAEFITAAGQLADFALKYYGGSTDYGRTRDQIIADTEALRAAGGGGVDAGTPVNDNAAVTGQVGVLVKTVQDLTDQLKISLEQNAILQGQVNRLLGNSGR